jgi:hypothetical protein
MSVKPVMELHEREASGQEADDDVGDRKRNENDCISRERASSPSADCLRLLDRLFEGLTCSAAYWFHQPGMVELCLPARSSLWRLLMFHWQQ